MKKPGVISNPRTIRFNPQAEFRSHQEEYRRLQRDTAPSARPIHAGRLALRKSIVQEHISVDQHRLAVYLQVKDVSVDPAAGEAQYGPFHSRVGRQDTQAQAKLALPAIRVFQHAVAKYEHAHYPDARYSAVRYVYDQAFLAAREPHRTQEVHRDALLTTPARIYIATSIHPTEFYPTDELFSVQGLTRPTATMERVVPEPYDITLIDTTTFHRAPAMPEDCVRTFFRVIYELQE
jgi:hypothetical protein